MSKAYNENSRVKIPVILHLMRLGFEYLSLKEQFWDKNTNIFPQIFIDSLCRINQGLSADDAKRQLVEITLELDNEDLGQAFYHRLINQSGIRLIDFNDFDNNRFHVVSELPCIHGDLVFGVSDKGEIQDLQSLGDKLDNYRKLVFDFIAPPCKVQLEEIIIDDKLVFIFHVEQDLERIFYRKDNEKFFIWR
ncbi:AlbA family DNA-binding domain-containing protein [Rappaport israeli]|uniref:AlbA family DNA-binding domain-containing protein n=1 Tax=Rappaport israeli TaxID=1839807 RepID=UPI0009313D34|nr:type I restriction endonuclease [Rappaport israeli]